jgi:glycosyltransferase involved in cell wall biosynthesis
MSAPSVAIVHLGRAGSRGAGRRVESLRSIFTAWGATVHEIALMTDHRAGARDMAPRRLAALAAGRMVPEAMAWSLGSLQRRLRDLAPDIVVCETARAFDPALLDGPWRTVLDFVDQLSVSYADRAAIVSHRARGLGYRALAATARRFERGTRPSALITIAAGWSDAQALRAAWLPITVETAGVPPTATDPDVDVLFFGTLSYPPNIDAVERLGELWPEILRRRPATTALVAGAQPPSRVVDLARRLGWTLVEDFASVEDICARARLAVVPLRAASGIQIKLLDAAANDLAQVVDPVALNGFAPGFPALAAGGDAAFVDGVIELLDHAPRREALATAAFAHVAADYSAATWAARIDALIPPRATS